MTTDDPLAFLTSNPALLAAMENLAAGVTIPRARKVPTKGHYYREEHALWVRDKILIPLHADKQPLKVTIENQSVHTIRLHYYQGAEYLRDKLDPSGHYKTLIAQTKCDSTGGDFLLFLVRRAKKTSDPGRLDTNWKEELQDFLESAVHGDKFARPGLLLSQSELLWIESQLCGIAHLFSNTSNGNGIMIIRFDADKL